MTLKDYLTKNRQQATTKPDNASKLLPDAVILGGLNSPFKNQSNASQNIYRNAMHHRAITQKVFRLLRFTVAFIETTQRCWRIYASLNCLQLLNYEVQ